MKSMEKSEKKPKGKVILSILASASRIFLAVFLIVFSICVVSISLALQPVISIYSDLKNVENEITTLTKIDIPSKDLTRLDQRLDNIDKSLASIEDEIGKYDMIKNLPGFEGYYANLQKVKIINQKGRNVLSKTRGSLKIVLKSAGFKVEEGDQLSDTASISSILKSTPELIKIYDDSESDVLDLIKAINSLDENAMPGGIKDKIVEVKSTTVPIEKDFPEFSAQIRKTLNVLPNLLGIDKRTTYLIVFQNEKELRPSGGLLTAFGTLSVENGEVIGEISSTDMWVLEKYVSYTIRKTPGYQNIYGGLLLMQRGCGGLALRAQDAGIYGDVQVSMNMFKDYYNIASKADSKTYPKYDHILVMNTFFASDLIKPVEPIISPEGKEITSENLARSIIEKSYKNNNNSTRKSIIGDIADSLKAKYEQLPANKLPEVLSTVIKTIQHKNLAFQSIDPEVQTYFDDMGLTARSNRDDTHDYFALSEGQVCAYKANYYIYDNIYHDIKIADNGSVTNKVQVEWVNEKVLSRDPLEEYILPTSSNYLYRAWERIVTQPGTDFTSTDGLKASRNIYSPVEYYDKKLGKQVSDNVIWWDHRRYSSKNPVKKGYLNVSYKVPDKYKYTDDGGYTLFLEKHPGKMSESEFVKITYKGETYESSVSMDRDKIVTFKDGVLTIKDSPHPLDQFLELLNK